MVIFQCFLYIFGILFECVIEIIGMFPHMIYYILNFLLAPSSQLAMVNNVTRGVLYISHGTTFFIHIYFNRMFRKVLIRYLKLIIVIDT